MENCKFQDAVSFFNDPSSLNILENKVSTVSSKALVSRSSLYRMFDPLYAKSFCNIKSNELQEAEEGKIKHEQDKLRKTSAFDILDCEVQTDKLQDRTNTELIEIASNDFQNDSISQCSNFSDLIFDIMNKSSFIECPVQSLLSFDSTPTHGTDSHFENRNEKIYSEDELQQALKVKELSMLETFMQKEKDLEESFLRKQQDLEAKLKEQMCLNNSLYSIQNVVVDLVNSISNHLEIAEGVNEIKEEFDTFVEELQNVNKFF